MVKLSIIEERGKNQMAKKKVRNTYSLSFSANGKAITVNSHSKNGMIAVRDALKTAGIDATVSIILG